MPSGLCSYMIGGVEEKPGWFAVFRSVVMQDSFYNGTLYQLSAWSAAKSEFIQIERMDPVEHENCWPTAFAALMVLSPLLAPVKTGRAA